MTDETRYIPAAGHRALTRLYDPAIALTTRERRWRAILLDRIGRDLPTGATALDVGCGTGTFAIALAKERADAEIVAIDGDPEILELAQRKPGADAVRWRRALADELPLDEGEADAVVMSLFLHHLAPDGKRSALGEALRVLRPGGHLHIADWGRPHDALMRSAFALLQLLDGFENTRDHAAGRLPAFVEDAGFEGVTTRERLRTLWGTLEVLQATRP